MHSLYLKPKEHRRLFKGHLWSFSNELQSLPKDIAAGETVKLYTHDNKFVGTGFYNPHSLIAFRLLSRTGEVPESAFFREKILKALDLRAKIYSETDTNAFRLVHGESDGLPGLVIDRFNTAFSLQAFSAGMDRHLPLVCDVLADLFQPSSIVVRNESSLRELEGLPLYKKSYMAPRQMQFRSSMIPVCVIPSIFLKVIKRVFSSTRGITAASFAKWQTRPKHLMFLQVTVDLL